MATNKQWNILCWNERGINSEEKQLAIRNAIEISGCSVVCFQETKRETFDASYVKLFCPKKFDMFEFVPSVGNSGGLITAWMSSVFTGVSVLSESFALGVRFTSTQSNDSWTLVNVYGPCADPNRALFTAWLFDLQIPNGEDWLILGDFNYIRAPDNRNRGGGNANDMLIFNEFIRSHSLVEIPIKGRAFTWSNMQTNPLLEQLDWHFTSVDWAAKYPNTLVMPLGRPTSDHVPCYVSIQTKIPKTKLFRFEDYWIKQPGFFDVVQCLWNKRCYAPNAAAVLCKKLKTLRYDLKQWSKTISKLTVLIDNCNKTLLEIDGLEERRRLSVPEANFRNILKRHLLHLLDCKKAHWKKRCTVRYFKFGDGNTKFFHRVATERFRRNNIASLRVADGSIVYDHGAKEAVLLQTYKERLGGSTPTNMKFDLDRIIKK